MPDGPFDLTATSRGQAVVLGTGLRVGPGTSVRLPVPVDTGVRTTVTLTRPTGPDAVRTLVLQP